MARVAGLAGLVLGVSVVAQPCEPGWLTEGGVLGVDGAINTSAIWDPDGPGPATQRLVVAGNFLAAGSVAASNIATCDLHTGDWSSIGLGLEIDGSIHALAVLPGGDLVIGGDFSTVGGAAVSGIARWNGNAWSPLGAGTDDSVRALAVLPGGDLVAAGDFQLAGDVQTRGIARWNGVAWSAFGAGLSDPGIVKVNALAVLGNGDVVAGGIFQFAGGVESRGIARWNGSAWSALGSGMNGPVNAMVVLPNGNLIVGGNFTTAGGFTISRIARWDGLAWSPLSTGFSGEVHTLEVLGNGDVLAAGWTGSTSSVRRWNGSTWSSLGAGMNGVVNSVKALPDGGVMALGHFLTADAAPANSAARWNGTRWNPPGVGVPRNGSSMVYAMLSLPTGSLVVGGSFTTATGSPANYLATWNGATWSQVGSGPGGTVRALVQRANGEVVAASSFTTAGGVAAASVARWDGWSWFPMGAGVSGTVNALAVLPDDSVVAGKSNGLVVRWNGLSWSPLGAAFNGPVNALAVLPDGSVVAGGAFTLQGTTATARVARWDGTAWAALGTGVGDAASDRVLAIAAMENGDVIVGGEFTLAGTRSTNAIARWNGFEWVGMGDGMNGGCSSVSALLTLPSGGLIAGGRFTSAGGVATTNVAMWDGMAWLGLGMQGPEDASFLNALAMLPSGDLIVGGWLHPGGIVARRFVGGAPAVAISPISGVAFEGETFTLTAAPINGMRNVSVRWRRNGSDVVDGPGGAASGGGLVSGASGFLPSPTRASIATLTIQGVAPVDAGQYQAVFTNACGDAATSEATVAIILTCAADFNQDGGVDGLDLQAFFAAWEGADPSADVNRDGGVDGPDVESFILVWEAGGC